MASVEVVCPSGVTTGEMITVTVDGEHYELALPPDVSEGEVFNVNLGAPTAVSGSATPAQLAGMQKMVRDMATGFLQVALQGILQEIDRAWQIQRFVDDKAAAFADYSPSGEQLLEWTAVHEEYCALVEQHIGAALTELSCDAATVFEYAADYGGDPRADKLLSRLLAMSDYAHFAVMMRESAEAGPSAC